MTRERVTKPLAYLIVGGAFFLLALSGLPTKSPGMAVLAAEIIGTYTGIRIAETAFQLPTTVYLANVLFFPIWCFCLGAAALLLSSPLVITDHAMLVMGGASLLLGFVFRLYGMLILP